MENHKFLSLLEQLTIEWELGRYDRTLLTRLSFLPEPVLHWGFILQKILKDDPPGRDQHSVRYISAELKNLSPRDRRKIMASGFGIIPEKTDNQNSSEVGISKYGGTDKQSIMHLLLTPLFDYLIFLQGTSLAKYNYNRAHRETSLVLHARYPYLWPDNPT